MDKDYIIEITGGEHTRYVHPTGLMFRSMNAAERFTKDEAERLIVLNRTDKLTMTAKREPQTTIGLALGTLEVRTELLEMKFRLFER